MRLSLFLSLSVGRETCDARSWTGCAAGRARRQWGRVWRVVQQRPAGRPDAAARVRRSGGQRCSGGGGRDVGRVEGALLVAVHGGAAGGTRAAAAQEVGGARGAEQDVAAGAQAGLAGGVEADDALAGLGGPVGGPHAERLQLLQHLHKGERGEGGREGDCIDK